MPALRFLNLFALALVALVAISPAKVDALAAGRAQVARHVHAHDAIARRKRGDSSSQCKPRPSSSTPTPTSPASTPPPTSTTSTSSAPAATSPVSSSNQKWCLAWSADIQYLSNFAKFSSVRYFYNWSPEIPAEVRNYPNIAPMSMLWDYKQAGAFKTTVVPGYAKYAMGVNEPNEPSQSNMSPQDAFTLWMTYINYLGDEGYTLISPACTNDQSGLDWYKAFMELCDNTSGCRVDIMAFHAYTVNAQDLINYANTLHDTYGRPVMITEFADQNYSGSGGQADMNQIWDYAGQVKPFVESTPWIVAACPFGLLKDLNNVNVNPLNSLMDENGNPTALADFYFN